MFKQGVKYLWKLPTYNKKAVEQITTHYMLSFPVAQTLENRKFLPGAMLDTYLFGQIDYETKASVGLKDAQKAVERLVKAIEKKEKILICGDYDVDGITSSALMMICLIPLGAEVNFFIPHRVKDGYGLSEKVIERAAKNNYKVVITVDNGVTAFTPAKKAKELGIDLIITDHHKPHDHLPDAFALINPHQKECLYPFKYFAGVGVSFKLLTLLYEYYKKELPTKAYELMLFGTVADVVPLVDENRLWVRHGLNYVNKTHSYSLQVLKKNGKVEKPELSASDIGFSIAPQINALGRLEDPRCGVNFLIGQDKAQVEEVGQLLLQLNEKRKEIEKKIVFEIQERVAKGDLNVTTDRIILLSSKAWPPGVIGLVASRIVGLYGRPTLLLHETSNGLAKGSCRSIKEFNMFEALESAKHLLTQFGGHAQAAGLALPIEHIPLLKNHLEERATNMLTEIDLQLKLSLDAHLTIQDVNKKLINDLALLEPFGNENEAPLFYLERVQLLQSPQLLKDIHVKCMIFNDGIIKPVIFFNRPELFEVLLDNKDKYFSMAVRVTQNIWQSRISIELIGVDLMVLEDN
ncbi:single-stranded-DNA-specific exonuclease RecJ [Candidatus Dependentiae bacterium]|nr:MAG: single-stranded-DNA-specific exonuclease RecJ [Candidatus Dependentiae bacterium]